MRPIALLSSPEGRERLERICGQRNLDPATLRGLVTAVRSQAGKLRRHGLYAAFDVLLADGSSEE